MPTDQEIIQTIQKMFTGTTLREIVSADKGITLIFESSNEQAISMTLSPNLMVNLANNSVNATAKLNISTVPALTVG